MKYYWKNGFYIDEINFDIDPDSGTILFQMGTLRLRKSSGACC